MIMLENRMVRNIEKDFSHTESRAVCDCCEEAIRQEKALHLFNGKRKMWICDRCIDDLKEYTGFEED